MFHHPFRYSLCRMMTLLSLLVIPAVTAAGESGLILKPPALELGEIDGENQVERAVVAQATAPISVTRLLSTCPCVSLTAAQPLPLALAAGDAFTITISVDPTSYEGAFSKIAFIETKTGDDARPVMTRLTVTGIIKLADGWPEKEEEANSAAVAEKPSPQAIPYESGMDRHQLARGVVLFLTPDCDQCNWVRLLWLPRYLRAHPQATVYTVDLSTEEGLDLLLAFEAMLPPDAKGDAPVAWHGGNLHYGTRAIAALLKE